MVVQSDSNMNTNDEEIRIAIIDYLKARYLENPAADFDSAQIALAIHKEHSTYELHRLEGAVVFLFDVGKLNKRILPRGDVYYRLSGDMVNEVSPSQYAQHPISPVTIVNNGVFVNGANYGQISQNTKEAFEIIDKIVGAISASGVENTKKMELVANAETIRAQLMSPTPDTDSIKKSWNILNGAVQFGAALVNLSPLLMELANKLSPILPLLQHIKL